MSGRVGGDWWLPLLQGEVVYVNYGGPEEYGLLQKLEIPIRGRLGIARMGGQTVREKVSGYTQHVECVCGGGGGGGTL